MRQSILIFSFLLELFLNILRLFFIYFFPLILLVPLIFQYLFNIRIHFLLSIPFRDLLVRAVRWKNRSQLTKSRFDIVMDQFLAVFALDVKLLDQWGISYVPFHFFRLHFYSQFNAILVFYEFGLDFPVFCFLRSVQILMPFGVELIYTLLVSFYLFDGPHLISLNILFLQKRDNFIELLY